MPQEIENNSLQVQFIKKFEKFLNEKAPDYDKDHFKQKLTKILDAIDNSAKIDDKKFNKELSKVKELAYEKGTRINYTPDKGFRDLSVVTKLGNKVDKNEFKQISIEDIKNIIENAPEKQPAYSKNKKINPDLDDLEQMSTNSRTNLQSLLKNSKNVTVSNMEPKSILKKPDQEQRPKKNVQFENLVLQIKPEKDKYTKETQIDYGVLKSGNQAMYNDNLTHNLTDFVYTIVKNKNLSSDIENNIMEYAAATKNKNIIKHTAVALVEWNIKNDRFLLNVDNQLNDKIFASIKEEIQTYRDNIKETLTQKEASQEVIADVLKQYDQYVTQPVESATPTDITKIAQKAFDKFATQIGGKINTENRDLQTTDTSGRISELKEINQQITKSQSFVEKAGVRLNQAGFKVPLTRIQEPLTQKQDHKAFNNNLIKDYQEIVQPTLGRDIEITQKILSKIPRDSNLKTPLIEEKKLQLIEEKIQQINAMKDNKEKTYIPPIGQRRIAPVRGANKREKNTQNVPVSTHQIPEVTTPEPLKANQQEMNAKAAQASEVAKSKIANKTVDNSAAAPPLSRRKIKARMDETRAALSNKGGSTIIIPGQPDPKSPQKQNVKNPQPTIITLDSGKQIQLNDIKKPEDNRIDAIWEKLQKNADTKFITKVTGEPQTNPTSQQKMQIMQENIEKHKVATINASIASSFGIKSQDSSSRSISRKGEKIIEFSSKSLDSIARGNIDKADSYLKKINNIDKPGIIKKAAITVVKAANDQIIQPIAQKSDNIADRLKQNVQNNNTESRRPAINRAKAIGSNIVSIMNEYLIQKAAKTTQEQVNKNNIKKKGPSR
ncbi:MAG: hypothetical protein H6909_00930 [Rickettsiaceae bacterium]|nr:hypothetical protein [Rickettsiaceae bacterium]